MSDVGGIMRKPRIFGGPDYSDQLEHIAVEFGRIASAISELAKAVAAISSGAAQAGQIQELTDRLKASAQTLVEAEATAKPGTP